MQVDRLLEAVADDVLQLILGFGRQERSARLLEQSSIQRDRADAVGAHMARDEKGRHRLLLSHVESC